MIIISDCVYLCNMESVRIKATELRIGNYVKCANWACDEYLAISGVYETTVRVPTVQSHFTLKISSLHAIPLTEEILTAWCGFNVGNSEHTFIKDGINLEFDSKQCMATLRISIGRLRQPILVSSLHQLQNLYYALTGFELAVTPTYTSLWKVTKEEFATRIRRRKGLK